MTIQQFPVVRNIRPESPGRWRWELAAESATGGEVPHWEWGEVHCIPPLRLATGLLSYSSVSGCVSVSEAVMIDGTASSDLTGIFGTFARDLLRLAPSSDTSIGTDALEKTEALLGLETLPADHRLPLLTEAARSARQTIPGGCNEAPAIGLGRLVLAEDRGPVNLLAHPGTFAPVAAQIGRWVEELGLIGLLFREKSPAMSARTQFLIRSLDRWTEPCPELVTRNALLALGAHLFRRLHGPSSPQGTIAAMLDFAEALVEQPESIGLPWRSAT